MEKPTLKDKYTIEDLMDILTVLRSENGCPWDKVQTHESIKKSLIEESYEAIDALDRGDDALFANELGDVLLQVAFHAKIASERGAFDFDNVLYEVCNKLITRHTHVFGGDHAQNAEEALKNWDKNKKKEQADAPDYQILDEVPHHLPSLLRAEKVQKKACSFGAKQKPVGEEADEMIRLLSSLKDKYDNGKDASGEMKHILFSCAALAKALGGCAETDLADEINAFIDKFKKSELQEKQENIEF